MTSILPLPPSDTLQTGVVYWGPAARNFAVHGVGWFPHRFDPINAAPVTIPGHPVTWQRVRGPSTPPLPSALTTVVTSGGWRASRPRPMRSKVGRVGAAAISDGGHRSASDEARQGRPAQAPHRSRAEESRKLPFPSADSPTVQPNFIHCVSRPVLICNGGSGMTTGSTQSERQCRVWREHGSVYGPECLEPKGRG